MEPPEPPCRNLEPLPYHASVVAYLRTHEPEIWQWASSQKARQDHIEEVRTHLLRDTYRLEPDAHPDIHAQLALAMRRLGIAAPATLYQSGGQQMNAVLVHVPGEVHMVLQGPVLERLDPGEQLALFGHELAHYLLWTLQGGDFLTADRILQDALASTRASDSHRETLRRYSLHTELFADRGGALAAGAVAPAVSTLVKVHTGTASVDAEAYLRQATEVDARDAGTSEASSHPETFVRARALDLWWQESDALETWLDTKLHGPMALDRLDLPGQLQLQTMTRGFLSRYLADTRLHSDAVFNQVRTLFPDWQLGEAAIEPGAFQGDAADDSVRSYLNALMLDLALVDPDVQEAALLRAAQLAQAMGSLEALQSNLKRDAGFGKRELDRLTRQLSKGTAA